MPNAVWTGTLSFGLVAVPVRLFPATEPKDVRFHLYDESGRRVRYQRVVAEEPPADVAEPPAEPSDEASEERPTAEAKVPAEAEGPVETAEPASASPIPVEREIAWENLLRGRETETGEVVMLTREEIEQVRPQRSRTIDVEDFVDLRDIDPVFFEKSYYAVPSRAEAVKPYVLLHRAMQRAGRVGIGRFVLRTKPHLVAVRPMEEVLAVETLFFGDEVRDPRALAPMLDGEAVSEQELDLAERLIETLKTEWDPNAYADTYREDLLRLLAEKDTVTPPEPAVAAQPAASHLEELMTVLRESVEAAKQQRKPKRSSTRAG